MTLSEFKHTTSEKTPPATLSAPLRALWHDAKGEWDAAHEVANEASFRIRDQFTDPAMQDACKTEAAKHDVDIVKCDFDRSTQEVVVIVHKHARSFLLDKFDATKDWYDVEASARAEKK